MLIRISTLPQMQRMLRSLVLGGRFQLCNTSLLSLLLMSLSLSLALHHLFRLRHPQQRLQVILLLLNTPLSSPELQLALHLALGPPLHSKLVPDQWLVLSTHLCALLLPLHPLMLAPLHLYRVIHSASAGLLVNGGRLQVQLLLLESQLRSHLQFQRLKSPVNRVMMSCFCAQEMK